MKKKKQRETEEQSSICKEQIYPYIILMKATQNIKYCFLFLVFYTRSLIAGLNSSTTSTSK